VYLAYIDESGSTADFSKGGSKSYALACVLVAASRWTTVLGGLTRYRRYLERDFGLLASEEVKANHLA
jgi:hypothetical protein